MIVSGPLAFSAQKPLNEQQQNAPMESTYTIYVKTMTGLVLPVVIGEEWSGHDVYCQIHCSLPLDIRPLYLHQMELFRVGEDGVGVGEDGVREGEEEKLYHSEIFPGKDGEEFCLLIHPSVYSIALNYISSALDLDSDLFYERWRLVVIRDDIEAIYTSHFYSLEEQEEDNVFYPEDTVEVLSPTSEPYYTSVEMNRSVGSVHLDLEETSLTERVRDLLSPVPVSDDVKEDLIGLFLTEWREQLREQDRLMAAEQEEMNQADPDA